MSIQITRFQLFLFLFMSQTGTVYMAFSGTLINIVKRDATIIFLIVAFLYLFQMIFYEKGFQYFILNKMTKFLYLLYWTCILIFFLTYTVFMMGSWVLLMQNIPSWMVMGLTISVLYYMCISRPETAINFGVIMIPFVFLSTIFLMRIIPQLDIVNLFPLFDSTMKEWLRGGVHSFYAFCGAECYLILRKYVLGKEKIPNKVLCLYVACVSIFQYITILFTIMYFSIGQIEIIGESIMYIFNTQEVNFMQRLDIVFVHIWFVWSMTTITNYLLVMRLVYFEKKIKRPRMQIGIYLILVGTICYFLMNYSIIQWFIKYTVYLYLIFAFIIPIIVILWNKIRGQSLSDTSKSSAS